MNFDPETMKVTICSKCRGLGFGVDLRGKRFDCAECGGTGRILVQTIKDEFTMDSLDEDRSFDREIMKVQVCKSCRGLGHIDYGTEERECEDCRGAGRLVEQKIQYEYRLHHLEGFEEE